MSTTFPPAVDPAPTAISAPIPAPAATATPARIPARIPARTAATRIVSIDALRGFVILLMLVDHAREFFYYHAQVSDPMDLATTPPALFFTRLSAHLCAPVFVLLTGLAASLYADARGVRAASGFLFKRGLFLVALELTVINFAWGFDPTPATIFLQVIWVIGLSMIALAALVHLPRAVVTAIGVAIVLGHNLLDPVTLAPGETGHTPWAILHDRGFIDPADGVRARTSYPLLPWIGVIALGWGIGPWFARADRRRRLIVAGAAMLALFVLLRTLNVYGDPTPWAVRSTALGTTMSFLNLTKYPPSADFLLFTLGIGAWLLAAFERLPPRGAMLLTVLGSAPLFFYIAHLYLLHALNRVVGLATGSGGTLVSVPNVASLWLLAAAVAIPCWFACRRFGAFKRRHTAWYWRYL